MAQPGPKPTIDHDAVLRLSMEAAARGGTYSMVAKAFGISSERVRQILEANEALDFYHRIRSRFEEDLLKHLREQGLPDLASS